MPTSEYSSIDLTPFIIQWMRTLYSLKFCFRIFNWTLSLRLFRLFFAHPTAIQCQGWPMALSGRDMVGMINRTERASRRIIVNVGETQRRNTCMCPIFNDCLKYLYHDLSLQTNMPNF
ncbi:unnamed protein product [Ambrosiozyma monospora]|uniref:Unnamed protein product n=1 Tax=Ambrosiozyma monospora TaxID=43982 RepID=A0ACB5TP81_AMBMO|nr:unnamed protein product [Ambrosiozyma monospora]